MMLNRSIINSRDLRKVEDGDTVVVTLWRVIVVCWRIVVLTQER